METVDTLISARWVIPIEPATSVLERHAVAVRQGRIVAILPADEAARRYSAREVLDRPTHALLPGLVNACADVFGGIAAAPADRGSSAPTDGWVDPELVHDAAELAMVRMISGGTTTFAATNLFPQVVARTAADLHLRACVGLPILEQTTPSGTTVDDYFEKATVLHDEYRADPLITTAFATGRSAGLTDGTLLRLRRDADEIELPVFIPLHESADAVALSVRLFGSRPLARLERLGLATAQLVGLHVTQLVPADLETLVKAGVQVIACPRSSLRGGGTPCPLVALHHRGVTLGLGTGDAQGLGLQDELHLASLLGDGNAGIRPILSSHDVLRMATLGGARALGIADSTGSLSPGKWADLCCVDLSVIRTRPVGDVVAQIVQLAGQDQVTDVWVAGRALLASGSFIRIDPTATLERATRWLS